MILKCLYLNALKGGTVTDDNPTTDDSKLISAGVLSEILTEFGRQTNRPSQSVTLALGYVPADASQTGAAYSKNIDSSITNTLSVNLPTTAAVVNYIDSMLGSIATATY